jgi:flagellar biogenesis protein FliO
MPSTFRWVVAAMTVAAFGAAGVMAAEKEEKPSPSSAAVATSAAAPADLLETKPLERTRQSGGVGNLWDWVQPLAALAIVVALIFLLRAVLKRLGHGRQAAAGGQVVQVLWRSHLSGRCELWLMRWGKRLLLVGIGAGGPVRLSEVSDPQEVSAMLAELGSSPHVRSGAVREVAEKIRSRLASDEDAESAKNSEKR